ncbi:HD domain-containing protein [bacterium]|nr:HD domain-containing protein [bacterium]
MLNYSEFNEYLLTYLSPEQCQQVHKAFLLAQSAHQTQTRLSGEPYITHPFEVAKILSTFQLDHETIQAGLLHDVLEDTAITKENDTSWKSMDDSTCSYISHGEALDGKKQVYLLFYEKI